MIQVSDSRSLKPDMALASSDARQEANAIDLVSELPSSSLSPNSQQCQSQTSKSTLQADEFRRLSASPTPSARLSPVPYGPYNPFDGEPLQLRPQSALQRLWHDNKPAALVALSQLFSASMNLAARLLELEGDGMHPVQVLFMRQSLTSLCCIGYMWWMNTPYFPLGRREIRWLLILRGCTGFFGIFGMWYSMMYLPLADATVITFLAPGVAGFVCYFTLREPFTRIERLATLVAFLGVVLIAQPAAFFAKSPESSHSDSNDDSASLPGLDHETTPRERLIAVGASLLGVLGAAGAFTTLRAIGKRAHPLISVNCFAVISTIICVFVLTFAPVLNIGQPVLRWTAPSTPKQWVLLFVLGGLGFIMQYLLTAGLSRDKSNKANTMIYTHMLFAASFDRWVFGHVMSLTSFFGCALILGSAIGVVMMRKKDDRLALKPDDAERQANITGGDAEAFPMLATSEEHGDEVRNRM